MNLLAGIMLVPTLVTATLRLPAGARAQVLLCCGRRLLVALDGPTASEGWVSSEALEPWSMEGWASTGRILYTCGVIFRIQCILIYIFHYTMQEYLVYLLKIRIA